MPSFYPVYLNLAGKRCVVLGGGKTAVGKIPNLLDAGARLTVISPETTREIQEEAQQGHLEWLAREYQAGDLEGAFLAIAATNVRRVNQAIFREAERCGVVLNVVDDPSLCTFIAPAIVKRGPVTLAISTSGTSPALARKLRECLSNDRELEWADLAGVLSRARSEVKRGGAAVASDRWQCCITEDLLRLVQAGKEKEALEDLLVGLLDGVHPGLCPEVSQCLPAGCRHRQALSLET